jgi:hypothetical protein
VQKHTNKQTKKKKRRRKEKLGDRHIPDGRNGISKGIMSQSSQDVQRMITSLMSIEHRMIGENQKGALNQLLLKIVSDLNAP